MKNVIWKRLRISKLVLKTIIKTKEKDDLMKKIIDSAILLNKITSNISFEMNYSWWNEKGENT